MGLLEILVTPDDGSGVRRIDSIELQDTSANPVRQYLGQCCQLLVKPAILTRRIVAAVEPHACDQVSCHQSVKKGNPVEGLPFGLCP